MNRADQRKYHYIYKTTRQDGSGKYYIGMHSTDNLDDGYLGSGQLLWKSIKKYGREKHVKEILEHMPSREALKIREKELVSEELLNDRLCMNIKRGGLGNSPLGRWKSEPMWQAISEKGKKRFQDPAVRKKASDIMIEYWSDPKNREVQSVLKKVQYESQALRDKVSEASKVTWTNQNRRDEQSARKTEHWKSEEYREKRKVSHSKAVWMPEYREAQRQAKKGKNNPNFGTKWVHNAVIKKSMRINKSDPIPNGWALGRKMYN